MALKVSSPRPYKGRRRSAILLALAAVMLLCGLYVIFFLGKATLFIGYTMILIALVPGLLGCSYRLKGERVGRNLRRTVWIVLLAAVLLAASVLGMVVSGAKGVMREEPTMVMVLGTQVRTAGPGPMLQSRLNTAYAYLAAHPELPVVVSGGQGDDEPMSEAQAMHDYLVNLGIDSDRIILEDRSHNTGENVRFSKEVLEGLGYDLEQEHVLIISNTFHLFRADMLAQRYGYSCSTMAAPDIGQSARVSSYIREIPAVLKSFLLD